MAYREGDAEAERRSEAELAAREALAPLAAEGRARRAGQVGLVKVPLVPRAVARVRAGEVITAWESLPYGTRLALERAARGLSTRSGGTMFGAFIGGVAGVATSSLTATVLLASAGALLGLLWSAATPVFRVRRRFRRRLSWLRSLPFQVSGYFEIAGGVGIVDLQVEATVEVHADDLPLVGDLLARASCGFALAPPAGDPGRLRMTSSAVAPELLESAAVLIDEVLVPLSTLHPVAAVSLRHIPWSTLV